MHERAIGATGCRHRQRGRRADGRPRARPSGPGHAVRGRLPARWPRGHPRGRGCRASTPASSCTTSAPTAPAAALRRARGGDPGLRHVDVGALGRHRARVGRCARSCGVVPHLAKRAASVVPPDAGRDPAIPPDGRRLLATAPESGFETVADAPSSTTEVSLTLPPQPPVAGTRRSGRSSSGAGSRRCSGPTSWSRWSPASGRVTRRSRWTTRRATCSPSCSTTACSRSSARRSGAPSPAARVSTSPGWPPACPTYAPAPR